MSGHPFVPSLLRERVRVRVNVAKDHPHLTSLLLLKVRGK
jgi:hypothetical protein